MDDFDLLMRRQRALRRASLQGKSLLSLWDFDHWDNGMTERHHIGRKRFSPLTMTVPSTMHLELTRRQMEEHPRVVKGNPQDPLGRLLIGASDLYGGPADALRCAAELLIKRPKLPGTAIVSYVAIDDIDPLDGFVFHQDVSEADLPSRARFNLKAYDLVISNVRPERGGVGIVLPAQAGAVGSSGLTVVRLKKAAERNLLLAILRTERAKTQLVRRSRGSMYPAITKDDVDDLLVPSLASSVSSEVISLVNESLSARIEFGRLHTAQEAAISKYLYAILGAPPPDVVLEVTGTLSTYIANTKQFFDPASNRFDAEFYRSEYIEFSQRLADEKGAVPLGSVYEAFSGANLAKGNDTLQRLRQAQLTAFGVNFAGVETVENVKASAKSSVRTGDVLIACTAHEPEYVGRRVDYVDELSIEGAGKIFPVPDVMIIRARNGNPNPPPAFLASFLRSPWGRRQFQRLNRGVRGGHVYGPDVEAFIHLPKPDANWLLQFTDRLEKIRAARRLSIAKMGLAVRLLDEELSSPPAK